MKMTPNEMVDKLETMFPQAHCELDYDSLFHLLCAVMLSAQTTDKSVNKITPKLFTNYPNSKALAKASINDVENLIRSIGLYHNKASNLIAMANYLEDNFAGEIPNKMEDLIKLPGVGRKTSNVVMAEGYKIPALPVDTHVERVAKRLGIVPSSYSVEKTENMLCRKIEKKKWIRAHHLFIFFGRYQCKSQNPQCTNCPFIDDCRYLKGKAK